ncbi:multi-sensor signal transduction histidine kinase [Halovivax asiaticus JCM 14624]|uniref:histidine kinase n=1 Tax=Halovivax asiaticus JCM 14624 TaxID=1227490 RepID=M0BG80_9EURY|nr:PAS domain-containing sensor histidine kinase [Halovivax asiaticus]ELZ09457.1 multi-sensor signal transduction histidine kinase [Halovivax asiaticus JCM 14624]
MRERIRVCWVGPTPEGQTQAIVEQAIHPITVTDRSVEWLRDGEPKDATVEHDAATRVADCFVLDLDADGRDAGIRAVPEETPVAVVLGHDEDTTSPLEAGAADIFRRDTVQREPALVARRLRSVVDASTARPPLTQTSTDSTRLGRYQTVVELAADPMYVLDSSGRCVLANDALARFSGYDRTDLVGAHASRFIGSAEFERASELLADLTSSDESAGRFEFTLETADGDERVGEATIVPVTTDDRVLGSVGVVRDISERTRRTRELARFRTIVETAPIGLFSLDETGTITWANDEFVAPFAESADEIVGESFQTLVERGYFAPEEIDSYVERVRTLLSDDTDVTEITHEPRLHTPDGETRTYRATLTTLPLDDGEFTGTVNAFREITDERRYQRELERQNDRLEQFASLVSHDLRNPLNVAQGHAELLEGAVEHDSTTEISWALERMETLIDDLLALARQGETVGEPERVNLGAVVDEAWAVVEGPVTLRHDVAGTVLADRSRLCELLTNLFRNVVDHGIADDTGATDPNATQATDHDSHANVSADNEQHPTNEPESAREISVGWIDGDSNPAVEPSGFLVADDGPGLPNVDVFEAGVTTDPDGTGIGLAIVAEIAEAHGWTVTAGESASGGARFEFRGVDSARVDRSGR